MSKPRATPCMIAMGLVLGLTACTNPYDPVQRTIGGGLIGAGSGAAIGAAAGGGHGAALGAAVGGAVGGAAGSAVGGGSGGPPGSRRGGGVGAVTGLITTPPPPVYYGSKTKRYAR